MSNTLQQLAICPDHVGTILVTFHLICILDAVLQALQQREESVRNGKLTTIVFIRDKNAKGQEVSGYIDYGHR